MMPAAEGSSEASARRRRTLEQLGRVSARLEALLAGQDVRIADVELPEARRPGETPLERLQRLRELLGQTLRRIDAGEATACSRCGREVPPAELDELPWATCCRVCVG